MSRDTGLANWRSMTAKGTWAGAAGLPLTADGLPTFFQVLFSRPFSICPCLSRHLRASQRTRRSIAAPEFGAKTLCANLGRAAGQTDSDVYALI
jgi:hypothetical protein